MLIFWQLVDVVIKVRLWLGAQLSRRLGAGFHWSGVGVSMAGKDFG
jgi:hypothetical protein